MRKEGLKETVISSHRGTGLIIAAVPTLPSRWQHSSIESSIASLGPVSKSRLASG